MTSKSAWSRRGARYLNRMRAPGVLLVLAFLMGGGLAQEAPPNEEGKEEAEPSVRFAYVDVYVDAKGKPLAAYQFDFKASAGEIRIVSVEGGEHPAFRDAPYYDPAARSKGRIIIAAFSTARDLPASNTRVARLHVQILGDVEPEYEVKLETAASVEARPIGAVVTAIQGEAK